MTQFLMDYLAEAESDKIHYNVGEKDITTMYGIYRVQHPKAAIFKRIDEVAQLAGVTSASEYWLQSHIDKVNKYISNHNLNKEFRQLASDFYKDYFEAMPLDKFPNLCQVSVFSMYTNSQKYAVMAVQDAINTMIKMKYINGTALLSVDGVFGKKFTAPALVKVSNFIADDEFKAMYFESILLLHMSKRYALLAKANPEKYLKYLEGWMNRLEKLSRI